jgi:hypothetical protein
MLFGEPNVLTFDQPKPGLTAMWGSAAWAQTQITPGVSALAAPLQMWLAKQRTPGFAGASDRN